MHPNSQYTSSTPYDYNYLEEQLRRLTLSNNPSSLRTPSTNSLLYYHNNNSIGINNNNYNTYNNSLAYSYPNTASASTLRFHGLTGQADREYISQIRRRSATPSTSDSFFNNRISNDEYLAMLDYYLHSNYNSGNNRLSGFRTRVENYNHEFPRTTRRTTRANNIEQRVVRSDVNSNNNYNRNNYRNINENYSDIRINWEELRGNVSEYVKDPQRYKIMLQMLEKASRDEINMILSEVKEDLSNIVVTHTGGQFFQSLLDFCDGQDDVTQILRAAMVNERYFVDICLDNHGSRAMQKLIKKIDGSNDEQKSIILTMMKQVMLTLLTNMNSYYFVTELFSSLKGPAAYDLITPLFDEIADHLLHIAVDKFGCCALHICIEHGHKGAQRDRVLHKIVSHALELSENDYGNYVVQYVISKRQEHFSDAIIRSLYGKFAYFCMNKYACYVVEKCILFGTNEHLERIINEIMQDPNFLNILLNQTGNYVVQKAITRCNEVAGESETLSSLFYKLTDDIIAKYPFLHYDRLGKHVLLHAKTEKDKHRRRMFR